MLKVHNLLFRDSYAGLKLISHRDNLFIFYNKTEINFMNEQNQFYTITLGKKINTSVLIFLHNNGWEGIRIDLLSQQGQF